MNRTLHMIGNAHIDPVWLWRWPEGMHEVLATLRSALDRLRESDDFVFTASSSAFFAWVEDNDPEMFAEIRQRVAEGRFEIVGGMWVEPDCNVPCGESFVRQLLVGQRWLFERLGVRARIGFNPDSFGHHGMLPQILRKAGLDAYAFLRPQPHEMELPARLFWWESPDGSRVLTYRIPFEYLSGPEEIEEHVRRCAETIDEAVGEGACFYGVGNHGGGPTKANLASIRRLRDDAALPALPLSSLERFFDCARPRAEKQPVVRGELQHHARGCYAAHSAVKQWNRRAESLLMTAERLSALACRVVARPYPTNLAPAWRPVLFNQFHDILAGTSIESAYEDARDGYGAACHTASEALHGAAQAIAWRVKIPMIEKTRPLVIVSPHAWPLRARVEVEVGVTRAFDEWALVDESGTELPMQRVQSEATVTGGRRRIAATLDVPSLGWRTVRLVPRAPAIEPTCTAGGTWIDNGRIRIVIDPETGELVRLRDVVRDVDLLAAPARAVVVDDPSDTWSHGVVAFDQVVGAFRANRVQLLENGPARATLRVISAFGDSELVQDYVLWRDATDVDVRVAIDWREKRRALKLRFPVAVAEPRVTYEIPYGHIERAADGAEQPGQSWVDVSGTLAGGAPGGFTLINDAKHGFDVTGAELGVTALRSPILAHHDPYVPTDDLRYEYLDQGKQRFRYLLVPHAGSWREAGIVRRTLELTQPVVAVHDTYHDGPLPPERSCGELTPSNAVLTVLKRAEDGRGWIARVVETHGVATHAELRLDGWGRTLEIPLGAHEIKTLRIPDDANEPVVETNLLEEVE